MNKKILLVVLVLSLIGCGALVFNTAKAVALVFPNIYQITYTGTNINPDADSDALGNVYVVYEKDGSVYSKINREAEQLIGTGLNPSIAIDSANIPHVIYLADGFVTYTSLTDGTWSSPVAIVSCDSASIDTDSSNNVYIAYSVNEGGYNSIYLLNKNSGEPEKLLEGGLISDITKNYTKPVIKIDGSGNYHITYLYSAITGDPVTDAQYVRVITNTTGNSTSETISAEATGVMGANSLALDGSNNAYVVYTIDSSVLEAKISGENSWEEYAVTSGSDIPASISADGSSIGIAYSASNSIRYKDDLGNGSYSSVTLIDEGTNPVLVLNTNKYVYYEKGGNIWLATDKDIPDVTAPVITLLGTSPVDVTVDETYTDAGVTALDETDGDITASVVTTGTVDTTTVGTYTITYNVSDTAGNPAPEVTRTVNVVPVTPPGGGGGTTYHTIKASASENGSITPSGFVSVPAGSNQIFTITANTGYSIIDVLVDSISKGAIATYTFENVTEGHTISVIFSGTSTLKIADINKDGVVNEYDLALLMSQWGKTGSNLSADLNKDGVVNEYDFAILMLSWTL